MCVYMQAKMRMTLWKTSESQGVRVTKQLYIVTVMCVYIQAKLRYNPAENQWVKDFESN